MCDISPVARCGLAALFPDLSQTHCGELSRIDPFIERNALDQASNVARVAHRRGLVSVLDNTHRSPTIQTLRALHSPPSDMGSPTSTFVIQANSSI